jgi:hypothetical protein
MRKAAIQYNIPFSTLRRRMNGSQSKENWVPPKQRLTPAEEEALLQRVLDLDSRGYPLKLESLQVLASAITQDRGADPVGVKWSYNFIQRTPELRTRITRSLNYRRALGEDPKLIREWFEVISNTKAKYGICDEDIYNFDETGFQMGQIRQSVVVTSTSKASRPKQIQGHSQEWITIIQGINSQGWALPPFIIFKGKQYQSSWYDEDFPEDWEISLSSNGWTTNQHGLRWLEFFDKYTKTRTKGEKRLLITDAHESHKSVEFIDYCSQNNIVPL